MTPKETSPASACETAPGYCYVTAWGGCEKSTKEMKGSPGLLLRPKTHPVTAMQSQETVIIGVLVTIFTRKNCLRARR